MKSINYLPGLFMLLSFSVYGHEIDTIKTTQGNLLIHFIGHGTLMFEFNGKVIHVDPYSKLAEYTTLPKADLILVTHHHGDHLDPVALEGIYKESSVIYWTEECQKSKKFDKQAAVIANGDKFDFQGIFTEVVPAYNIEHKRPNGIPFHPKGDGVGFIMKFGETRVYIAGDTENIPEMKDLGKIDIAFLPMNLPYTMTPEMVYDAALLIKPKVLYPYHFGKTDTNTIVNLLKDKNQIEVRIRKME
jgi:L-ascorbate metabolism protein UlaG (beta-lactamase superfamily)